jgi:hypothetical protein
LLKVVEICSQNTENARITSIILGRNIFKNVNWKNEIYRFLCYLLFVPNAKFIL